MATHRPDNSSELSTLLSGGTLDGQTLAAGDTIELQDGVTYSGGFTLTVTGTAGNPITFTRSGTVPDVPNMLVSSSRSTFLSQMTNAPVISTNTSTAGLHIPVNIDYVTLRGIEFAITTTTNPGTNTICLMVGYDAATQSNLPSSSAAIPDHITVDRCYLHGTTTGDCTYGTIMQANNVTITGCYFDEFHGIGQEAKCILVTAGEGPFSITNNYMRAASINIMFGGSAPGVTNLVPSNITFTGNYVTKKLSWKSDDPSYAGKAFNVKNLFELKSAQDVEISGNIFEYCWTQGQDGHAIIFTPENSGAAMDWVVVQRVNFENNIVRHCNGGFKVGGHDQFGNPSVTGNNIVLHNNLWWDLDSADWGVGTPLGYLGQVSNSPDDFTFTHNTADNDGNRAFLFASDLGGGNYQKIGTLRMDDNFFKAQSYFIFGDGAGTNQVALNAYVTTLAGFGNNVAGEPVDGTFSNIPATTDTPTIATLDAQWTNPSTGNYTVVNGSVYKAGGAKDATDNTDIGVDMSLLPSESTSGGGGNGPGTTRRWHRKRGFGLFEPPPGW